MPKILAFDIEANALLLDASRVWCMTVQDVNTEEIWSFTEDTMAEGVALLQTADMLVAHNGVGYDVPVLERTYGTRLPKCLDTLLVSRVVYSDSFNHPLGGNSLEDWGRFLNCHKQKYDGDFDAYTPEMMQYNIQDVKLLTKIYKYQIRFFRRFQQAIKLEHEVAKIITQQVLNGFTLDLEKAHALKATLDAATVEAEKKIDEICPPTTTIRVVKDGWMAGDYKFKNIGEAKAFGIRRIDLVQCTKTITTVNKLNCNSGTQIIEAMHKLYGWKPSKFSEKGNPTVDDKVLKSIDNPLAKAIVEHRLLKKRTEFVESWLACVQPSGRVHGSIITNGAPTGRMSHSNPNMAQVPKVGKPWGFECRSCWKPRDGWVLVGADASGLELRMLAHELAQWDGGDYANVILNGDIHVVNQKAAGLATRDQAKTFIYGLIYGAGDAKLGSIVGGSASRGRKLRASFERAVPAYGLLRSRVSQDHKTTKILYGIDGRPLPVRSEHAALNTLLQSHGAVVMKQALVLFHESAKEFWHVFAYCANVHDEIQIECDPSVATTLGNLLVQSIRRAGEVLGIRCRLDGEFKIGTNWAETH